MGEIWEYALWPIWRKIHIMSFENDVERFKNSAFMPPPAMVDGDLQLELLKTYPYNPVKGYLLYYRFSMFNTHTQEETGSIDLRVGLTEKRGILECLPRF